MIQDHEIIPTVLAALRMLQRRMKQDPDFAATEPLDVEAIDELAERLSGRDPWEDVAAMLRAACIRYEDDAELNAAKRAYDALADSRRPHTKCPVLVIVRGGLVEDVRGAGAYEVLDWDNSDEPIDLSDIVAETHLTAAEQAAIERHNGEDTWD